VILSVSVLSRRDCHPERIREGAYTVGRAANEVG
jgi:hypothetical protein